MLLRNGELVRGQPYRELTSRQITVGEMIAYLPVPGGHIKLAERFVDPAFAFAMGWNLWYNWAVLIIFINAVGRILIA